MLSILGSLTKNGWRETFRMIQHPENTIRKQPSPPRKEYVHIRQRDTKGRKMRASAFELVDEQHGKEAAKTYRRVNDGGRIEDGKIGEIVLEKKTVMSVDMKGQRQRPGLRETRKGTRKGVKAEREVSPQVNGTARPRHHRPSSKLNGERRTPTGYPSRRQSISEKSRFAKPQSHRHRETKVQSPRQARSSPSNRNNAGDGGGARSPFSQPDMNNRDSHTFVFGDDVLTNLSRTNLDNGESFFANSNADTTCPSMQSHTASRHRPLEEERYDSGSPARRTVTTVRESIAMTAPRGSSRPHSRPRAETGTGGTRNNSTKKSTSKRSKAGIEAFCSVV